MTPQEEIDLLLRVVLRLAEQQLEKGGFFPFGAVLGSNRDVQLLMPKGWKKDSTQDEMEAYWYSELRKQATKDGCKVVCFCADVRVPTEGEQYALAVNVYIEHAQADAANIYYPYRQNAESQIRFGKPTTVKTERQVFLNPQSPLPGAA